MILTKVLFFTLLIIFILCFLSLFYQKFIQVIVPQTKCYIEQLPVKNNNTRKSLPKIAKKITGRRMFNVFNIFENQYNFKDVETTFMIIQPNDFIPAETLIYIPKTLDPIIRWDDYIYFKDEFDTIFFPEANSLFIHDQPLRFHSSRPLEIIRGKMNKEIKNSNK